MKAWAAALASELQDWPNVHTKPMFGMTAFYRGTRIFAAVPRTRAVNSPNGLLIKLKQPSPRIAKLATSDPNIETSEMSFSGWLVYEMNSLADVNRVLRWLQRAYEAAKSSA